MEVSEKAEVYLGWRDDAMARAMSCEKVEEESTEGWQARDCCMATRWRGGRMVVGWLAGMSWTLDEGTAGKDVTAYLSGSSPARMCRSVLGQEMVGGRDC